MQRRPIFLIVLDGWGHREASDSNAILTHAPFFHDCLGRYPHGLLSASGEEVGLPLGLMGNSEVGHMNLGAGRVVYQDITRIDKSVRDGDFFENGALVGAMEAAARDGKQLHLLGLYSDGGVHASDAHVKSLLELAKRRGVPADKVCVHAILDGRDTPPRSGVEFLEQLERDIAEVGVGRIASVIGRFFAMDRDKRWQRVEKAYRLFVEGRGATADSATAAVQASYAADIGDEFVEPVVIGAPNAGRIEDGDQVVCFNYRADRMREICEALAFDTFEGFTREQRTSAVLTTMTQYRGDFPFAVAYPKVALKGVFSEIVSEAGLRQMRIAETEKYAHVTYFFSGGREKELPGESRILVQSPKVKTYDLQPQMSAPEVKTKILAEIERGETDVYIVNFANADMVGHTGIVEAAAAAVKAVDTCLSEIVPAVVAKGGIAAITADHGNDPTNQQHTDHTREYVPILAFGTHVKSGHDLGTRSTFADIGATVAHALNVPFAGAGTSFLKEIAR